MLRVADRPRQRNSRLCNVVLSQCFDCWSCKKKSKKRYRHINVIRILKTLNFMANATVGTWTLRICSLLNIVSAFIEIGIQLLNRPTVIPERNDIKRQLARSAVFTKRLRSIRTVFLSSSVCLSVRPSVCLSVCHTRVL